MKKTARRTKVPTSTILKAALDLFSTKGYEETKMSDIARLADLSVGALYLRFKGKEELCLELIRDQTKDYDETTRNITESGKEPFQALKDYIEFCIKYAFQKKQLLSLFVREHRLPFISPLRKRFLNTQLEIIRGILSAGAEKGVFRYMNHDETALMIFASIRGAVLLKIIFEMGDPKTISDSLFQLIDQGIRSHPE